MEFLRLSEGFPGTENEGKGRRECFSVLPVNGIMKIN
jgi:hypothetical protein